MNRYSMAFRDIDSGSLEVAGGKGANLGALTRGGFPVPRGFCITTSAYRDFLKGNDLERKIAEIEAGLDYDSADALDRDTERIRDLIVSGEIPQSMKDEFSSIYEELGSEAFVAVRSSATAEDLPGASFAGQHDTYLDIRGVQNVLDAVKKCWASMWTARAAFYRHTKGFDHSRVAMAVVVQRMVDSEVAGVMFTANPVLSTTREIVVNSSWGLGEGVVSGITDPDEYILNKKDLVVKNRVLGAKELMVVGDLRNGHGTVRETVQNEKRNVFTLSDAQLRELGELGKGVEEYYEGIPQDVEWAFEAGSFYLLQSRDITGAELTYDEEIERWQTSHPIDEDTIWTRLFSDEYWTGAISPLFYSIRGPQGIASFRYTFNLYRFKEMNSLLKSKVRLWKYYKAEVYNNTKFFELILQYTVPKQLRVGPALNYFPPNRHDHIQNLPFSYRSFIWAHIRCFFMERQQSIFSWLGYVSQIMDLNDDEIGRIRKTDPILLSDEELKSRWQKIMSCAVRHNTNVTPAFLMHMPYVLFLLGSILRKWYGDEHGFVLADLLTGLPGAKTIEENIAIWDLSRELRSSDVLLDLFEKHDAQTFFQELNKYPEAELFLSRYEKFLEEYGHRGHSDRDIYFPRRKDDPKLLYNSLRSCLIADAATGPGVTERELARKREKLTVDVTAKLRGQRFGLLKAAAFKALLGYVQKCMVFRDNERFSLDRASYEKKRVAEEFGRRFSERGIIEHKEDIYFLTKEEIFDIRDDPTPRKLIHEKTRARRRDFDLFNDKIYQPPKFLLKDRELAIEDSDADLLSGNLLRGVGTSPGTVTGVARVINRLSDIGRVEKGDILVTNSTDPGWTPVFLIISGLVIETGGLLAHGSILSREYRLPAITSVRNATRLIQDGSRITVDANAGVVHLT